MEQINIEENIEEKLKEIQYKINELEKEDFSDVNTLEINKHLDFLSDYNQELEELISKTIDIKNINKINELKNASKIVIPCLLTKLENIINKTEDKDEDKDANNISNLNEENDLSEIEEEINKSKNEINKLENEDYKKINTREIMIKYIQFISFQVGLKLNQNHLREMQYEMKIRDNQSIDIKKVQLKIISIIKLDNKISELMDLITNLKIKALQQYIPKLEKDEIMSKNISDANASSIIDNIFFLKDYEQKLKDIKKKHNRYKN